VFLLLALLASNAEAQVFPIKAEIDNSLISVSDTAILTVWTLGPQDMSPPMLPNLNGLVILNTESSSNVTIEGGVTTVERIYRYTLQPTRAGELIIDSVRINVMGQSYATSPIEIEVTESQVPSGVSVTEKTLNKLEGLDYFVESSVDNPNPYIGEQVIFAFRFYSSFGKADDTIYSQPKYSGFWSSDDLIRFEYDVESAGRTYFVVETRTPLFPTASGLLRIGSASVLIENPVTMSVNELVTDSIDVDVKPLPGGAPGNFRGAVGQFSIESQLENSVAVVNEPIDFMVTVGGEGNIVALPETYGPKMPNVETINNEILVSSDFEDGKLSGQRIEKMKIIPTASGSLKIPSITYSYFDPEQLAYVTIATRIWSVDVNSALDNMNLESVAPLKQVILQSKQNNQVLTTRVTYWLVWIIPLLLLTGVYFWKIQREKQLALESAMGASRLSRKYISDARKNREDVFLAVDKAMTVYLSNRLGGSIVGMTMKDLEEFLANGEISFELAQRVIRNRFASEAGRFSPTQFSLLEMSGDDLLDEAESLIADLERELSS